MRSPAYLSGRLSVRPGGADLCERPWPLVNETETETAWRGTADYRLLVRTSLSSRVNSGGSSLPKRLSCRSSQAPACPCRRQAISMSSAGVAVTPLAGPLDACLSRGLSPVVKIARFRVPSRRIRPRASSLATYRA